MPVPAKRYATDLTDAEFALIEPRLPPPSRLGRPRTTDLRAVLDAIFYLLRTGCQWRLLPKCFPPRSTVFGYFRRWWQDGTLLGLYYAPAGPGARRPPAVRRNRPPASSTANRSRPAKAAARAATTPARRSTAASGTSWSTRWACCCAASSIPPASRTATGWPPLLTRIRRRFPLLGLLFADGGYQGEVAAAAARDERLELAIVKRSDHGPGFVLLPRRWVVERSFAWFGRNRRLAKDVETLIASSTAMLYLAATRLLTRRLATP